MKNCESFSLRDGEMITILENRPDNGRWFAVMGVDVPAMPGEMQTMSDIDGLPSGPVQLTAIIACLKRRDTGEFVWMQLSPFTKEIVGAILFDNGAERNKWYYALITG